MLTYRGYKVSKEAAGETINKLSIAPIVAGKTGEKLRFYLEGSTSFFVPQAWGKQNFGIPKSQRFLALPAGGNWRFTGSLRPQQEEAIEAYMKSPLQCGLFHVPCGWGKTVAALCIASRLKLRTLIIVNEEDLGHQWVERASQYLPDSKVGWIQGPRFDPPENNELTIGMLQTLGLRDWGDYKELAKFGLIIVDEAHCIGSEVYTRSLMNLAAPWMLGLSATPRRGDGLTDVIHWFLGPTIYQQDVVKDPSVEVCIVAFSSDDPEYTKVTKHEYGPQAGRLNTVDQITRLSECVERNDFAFKLLMRLLEDPVRQVLVLCERLKPMEELRERLEEAGIVTGAYIGRKGKSKRNHREAIVAATTSRVVFGTYGKARQGLDIKTLNTLLLLSPQKDVEQSVGRILRISPEERVVPHQVWDIVDDIFPNLKRQAAERRKFYNRCNFTVFNEG